jgi:2-oxo-3-hexenedioate decarboxylase
VSGPQALADAVFDAFASRRLLPRPTESDPAFDLAAGTAVADALHARRRAEGWRPVGRKIGFTNRSLWPVYDVDAPIWAHVYDATVRYAEGDRADLSVDHLVQPFVEPEIQLHFARTPPAGAGEEELLACIDWIAAGYEIVQCPFHEWRFTIAEAVAVGSLHGALLVGPRIPPSAIEDCAAKLRAFTIAVSADGGEAVRGGGAEVLGSPLLAFAHLAAELGEPVQPGEVVTTGTLTPLLPAIRGATYTAAIDGIELPALELSLV